MRVYTGSGLRGFLAVGPSARLPVVAALARVQADWGLLSSCTAPPMLAGCCTCVPSGQVEVTFHGQGRLGRVVLTVSLVFALAGIRLG